MLLSGLQVKGFSKLSLKLRIVEIEPNFAMPIAMLSLYFYKKFLLAVVAVFLIITIAYGAHSPELKAAPQTNLKGRGKPSPASDSAVATRVFEASEAKFYALVEKSKYGAALLVIDREIADFNRLPDPINSGGLYSLRNAEYNRAALLLRMGRTKEGLAAIEAWLAKNRPVDILQSTAGISTDTDVRYFSTGTGYDVLRLAIIHKVIAMQELGIAGWDQFLAQSVDRYRFEHQSPRIPWSGELLSNAIFLSIVGGKTDDALKYCQQRVTFLSRDEIKNTNLRSQILTFVSVASNYDFIFYPLQFDNPKHTPYLMAEAHLNCGTVYEARGDHTDAIKSYETAIALSAKAADGDRERILLFGEMQMATQFYILGDQAKSADHLARSFEAEKSLNPSAISSNPNCLRLPKPDGKTPGYEKLANWRQAPKIKAELMRRGCG